MNYAQKLTRSTISWQNYTAYADFLVIRG